MEKKKKIFLKINKLIKIIFFPFKLFLFKSKTNKINKQKQKEKKNLYFSVNK